MGSNDLVYSINQYLAYNFFLIVCLIFLFIRNSSKGSLPLLIITLFFEGIAIDLGGKRWAEALHIFTLLWSLWIARRYLIKSFFSTKRKIVISLLVYFLYIILNSYFIHHDNILLVFSQLSKLLIPLLIFISLNEIIEVDEEKINYYHNLFGELLIVIIISSIAKLIIMNGYVEGWIGGITGRSGGGAGASLPLLGLLWLSLETKMQHKDIKYILFILGLLLISFASGKRAIWITFPILYLLLLGFVYKQRIFNTLFSIIIIVPIIFYLGLRLTPTLNPEHKIWGSFDPKYAYEYSLKYSTGVDKSSKIESDLELESGEGRIGSLIWLGENVLKGDKMSFVGRGQEYFIYADIKDYSNRNYYMGITYRGGITGIVRTFMTSGLIGVILFIIFIVLSFYQTPNKFSAILLITVLFDYIFYNAQTLNSPALLTFGLFLTICSKYINPPEIEIETKGINQ